MRIIRQFSDRMAKIESQRKISKIILPIVGFASSYWQILTFLPNSSLSLLNFSSFRRLSWFTTECDIPNFAIIIMPLMMFTRTTQLHGSELVFHTISFSSIRLLDSIRCWIGNQAIWEMSVIPLEIVSDNDVNHRFEIIKGKKHQWVNKISLHIQNPK